jgi:cell division septal protein FtsQ
MLLAVPQWRIREVKVDGCPELPPAAQRSLHELVGQPAIGLDLAEIRDRVEVWPGVGEVAIELQLPGTVLVRAEAASVHGSVRVGRGWHGVDGDGGLTGAVDGPQYPVLEGFGGRPVDRKRGLDAARRIAEATRGEVMKISRVTPADYRALLAPRTGDAELVVHVHPEGTAAERTWCAAFAEGLLAERWVDLRWSDRMVLGGAL